MMKHTAVIALAALVGCKGSQGTSTPTPEPARAQLADAATTLDATLDAALDSSNSQAHDAGFADVFSDADESQFVPLNRAAVGRGSGFWCFSATTRGRTDDTTSNCFRAQSECTALRRSSIDRGDVVTECAREVEAWCTSQTSVVYRMTVAQCSPASGAGYAGCVAMRNAIVRENRYVTRYRNLSRCELVR